MAIPSLSGEEIRVALKELEQALYNHDQWAETLFGTVICRLQPDKRDLAEEAHRLCRFGQWYYGTASGGVNRHAGFAQIGVEHEHMHRYACSLLRLAEDGTPISIRDYERFVSSLKRLRLEITTVQRELEDELYNLDPLTGTPSRLGMLTRLREEQQLVKRAVHACVVAMMDLDHFKAVNDRFGHAVGDSVLTAFARYIATHLRPYDKVFRYGGEEFLLCLPDTSQEEGHDILDRLRDELGSLPHEVDGEQRLHVTVSLGMTQLDPNLSVEDTVDRADRALYAAKGRGRNVVVMWDASMSGAHPPSDAAA